MNNWPHPACSTPPGIWRGTRTSGTPDSNRLLHFCRYGWREGRKPNQYFDPAWYLEHNPDVRAAGMNPLLHYMRHGDQEGRRRSGISIPPGIARPTTYRTTR